MIINHCHITLIIKRNHTLLAGAVIVGKGSTNHLCHLNRLILLSCVVHYLATKHYFNVTAVSRNSSLQTINWRASETLTGVTQLKIGDVSLLASERSERDSIRGG